ncbi:MAG: maleylacetoacetate isomerase [Aliishimia sp.]
MILYSYWRSTTSYRVRAALNLKGVAYETAPVDLVAGEQRDPTYMSLNPGAGVPTLVLDDGTALTQSMAILDYIDATWPEPRLIPADPLERAKVLAAAHSFALDVHPVNNLRVVKHIQNEFTTTDDTVREWMQHWMTKGCTALEEQISPDTTFSFGEAPDIADLCLVAQLYNAHRWGVDLTPFPKINRVETACLAIPEIAAAHPDKQPDAKVTT